MRKKIAFNVLYNIGIFLCLIVAFEGFEYARYEYVLGPVFIGTILVILKIRLIKEVRNIQNKP